MGRTENYRGNSDYIMSKSSPVLIITGCFRLLVRPESGCIILVLRASEYTGPERRSMPHSHHSHSGQFCKHATGLLEETVLEAIRQGFKVYGLTEHVPRYRMADMYPEEVILFSVSSM